MENTKNILSPFIPSDSERLNSQLQFTIEVDKMTQILRRTLLTDGSRRENDAEHSWHIALMCMLFAEYADDPPNVNRSAVMCIVHDLIEIYAGDTFAFDKEANKNKEEREKLAADKLFSQLPDEQAKEIRGLWEEFDAMSSADAKFAACMDRLQPFLHNTLTQGHTWVLSGANIKDVEERMSPVKLYMPRLWQWVQKNIENGTAKGWIKEGLK